MSVHRIATEHAVSALVAFDSFSLLAERVQRLLPVGRRLTAAHTYATYLGRPPQIFSDLTVAQVRVNETTHSLWVECTRDGDTEFGFGFSIRNEWLAETEEKAWRHFHAGRHEAEAFPERRRGITHVEVVGGRDGDVLGRGDTIVIRTYNGDGVCDERVISAGGGV